MKNRVKLFMVAGAFGVALLAGCASEGYVATGPVYVEPYPYDPYFYGPDVYIYNGRSYPRHYQRHEFSHLQDGHYYVAPRVGAPPPGVVGHESSHRTWPVPTLPAPNPTPQPRNRKDRR